MHGFPSCGLADAPVVADILLHFYWGKKRTLTNMIMMHVPCSYFHPLRVVVTADVSQNVSTKAEGPVPKKQHDTKKKDREKKKKTCALSMHGFLLSLCAVGLGWRFASFL